MYNELAWAYDPISWLVSGGRWQRWQRAIVPDIRGTRVLDLACGPGHLLTYLLGQGYDAYGLDRSPRMWRRAARRTARAAHSWRVLGGSALALPFRADTFDTILLTFPPPFVGDPRFWSEIDRVLHSGGRLIILEGASAPPRSWPRIIERLQVSVSRESTATTRISWGTLRGRRTVRATPDGKLWLVILDKDSNSSQTMDLGSRT